MKANMALRVCRKCKATCCKMGGADFTKKEMGRVIGAGYKNFFRKIDEDSYELKSKKGICPYLAKDNSCSIHNVRPAMCKCWPVYARYKRNKREFLLIRCPLVGCLSKKDISRMRKEAAKIPRGMLETTFTSSHLPKSDLKLIEKRFNNFRKKVIK